MNRNTWTRIRTGSFSLLRVWKRRCRGDWLLEGPAGRLVITRLLARSLVSTAASSLGQSRLLFGSFPTALIGSSVMSVPSLPASRVLVPGFRERYTVLCVLYLNRGSLVILSSRCVPTKLKKPRVVVPIPSSNGDSCPYFHSPLSWGPCDLRPEVSLLSPRISPAYSVPTAKLILLGGRAPPFSSFLTMCPKAFSSWTS